jgi:hypothetical protein
MALQIQNLSKNNIMGAQIAFLIYYCNCKEIEKAKILIKKKW